MRRCLTGAILLLSVTLAAPAWAQAMDAGRASAAPPAAAAQPNVISADEYHARAARAMEAKMARQERAAKRALSAVCAGCSRSAGRWQRRFEVQRPSGPDGLPYQRGEIE
jgi:hypothetical protein